MSLEAITKALGDLRQERERLVTAITKLDAAIAAVEAVIGPASSGVLIVDPDPLHAENASRPLFGPYTGKTIIAAAVEYLRYAKTPQPTNLIVNNLRSGGIKSDSKSLYRTLYNTLNNNLEKMITRYPDGKWGLKEWGGQN